MTIQLPVSTIENVVNDVAKQIANQSSAYLKFPSVQEQEQIASAFSEEHNFPGVIGIIDGCHVPISTPVWEKVPQLREKFFCRKYFNSWNCMAICDNKKKFIYFSCKFPGATHDSVAFDTSELKVVLDGKFKFDSPRFLLGDKGYTNQKILIVPFKNNQLKTNAQKEFNKLLGKVRVLIEHTFGMWKRLFPIFLYGVRKYKCTNSQATIIAGVVLYNIYRDLTDEEPPLPSSMSLKRFDSLMNSQAESTVTSRPDSNSFIRDQIVAQLFSSN